MPLPAVPAASAALLTPPPTDASLRILNAIFGPQWQHIITGGGISGGGTIFFRLLGALNGVVLAGVAVMLVYSLATGAMGTAHEGEAMGKRYHTLWAPIRSAVAVGALAPLPWAGGLSMIQAIVLAMVFWGIGGADHLAGYAIQYMRSHGGAIVTQPAADTDARNAAAIALNAAVIQYYWAQDGHGTSLAYTVSTTHPGDAPRTFSGIIDARLASSGPAEVTLAGGLPAQSPDGAQSPGGGPGRIVWTFHAPTGLSLPAGGAPLGSVAIKCLHLDSPLCRARAQGVAGMLESLYPIAQRIVGPVPDGARTYLHQRATQPPGAATRDQEAVAQAISSAISIYRNARMTGIRALSNSASGSQRARMRRIGQDVYARGWASLGSWYWLLSDSQAAVQDQIDAGWANTQPDWRLVQSASFPRLDALLAKTKRYISTVPVLAQTVADVRAAGGARLSKSDDLLNVVGDKIVGMSNDMIHALAQGDPIANLQAVGQYMLDAAYGMYGTIAVALGAATGVAHSYLETIPFIGAGLAGAAGVLKIWVVPAIFATIAAVIVGGMLLAFYLPAVPMILFIFSVIGWVILVIESVVAAVLWAAAHALPDGEGLAGQHGRQGYMLLLSVLLRPALTVIGFFGSFLLTSAVGHWIYEAISIGFASQNAAYVRGPFTALAVLIIGGGILIFAVHKTFELTTWLPEKVLRWVGQYADNLGESQSERQVYAAYTRGGGYVGGAATMAGKGVAAAHEAAHEMGEVGQSSAGGDNSGEPPSTGRDDAY
jgi:conjugal transfer/type IV secretion protein DotA/TraY